MDSQRLVLFFVFTMSVFLLFESWQRDQQAMTKAVPAAVTPTPMPSPAIVPAKPDLGVPAAPGAALTQTPAAQPVAVAADNGQIIKVETDLYRAEISTAGGDLVRLELLKHGGPLDRKKTFVLLTRSSEHV